MISSSISRAGLGSSAAGDDSSVDGAIIYQLFIDKKRKNCVITIEIINMIWTSPFIALPALDRLTP
jgi:hypothetical protein